MKLSNELRSPEQTVRHHVLWAITMAITVAALVLLFLALGHWWPADTGWYLTAGVAGLLLVAAAIVWGISTMYTVRQHRKWSWWLGLWPVVTALGVGLAIFAAPPDFADTRPQFEAMAQQLLDENDSQVFDLRIGRFEVGMAYVMAGDVYFSDARVTMFSHEGGWVYSPDGPPNSRASDPPPEALGGPWYRYQHSLNWNE